MSLFSYSIQYINMKENLEQEGHKHSAVRLREIKQCKKLNLTDIIFLNVCGSFDVIVVVVVVLDAL